MNTGEQVFYQGPGVQITDRFVHANGASYAIPHVGGAAAREEKRWGWIWACVGAGILLIASLGTCVGSKTSPPKPAAGFLVMLVAGGLGFLGYKLPRAFYFVFAITPHGHVLVAKTKDRAEADRAAGAIRAATSAAAQQTAAYQQQGIAAHHAAIQGAAMQIQQLQMQQARASAPPSIERVVERQVLVQRCRFCNELTPVDMSKCKACGSGL